MARVPVTTLRRIVATCSLVLACASSASAAIRHVTPSGLPIGTCAAAAPCSLDFAASTAMVGDRIVVAGGDYSLISTLDVSVANLTIEGAEGGARPSITSSGPAIRSQSAGLTLRRIKITGTTTPSVALVSQGPGALSLTLDRVDIRQTADTGGAAILAHTATITGSTVFSKGLVAAIVSGTITGSTLVCDDPSGSALKVSTTDFDHGAAIVRNSILRGGSGTDGDVRVEDADSGAKTASVDLDYSSFSLRRVAAIGVDATLTQGPGNSTSTPAILVDIQSAADVTQHVQSPTIDAGSSLYGVGSDFEGDPRTFGIAPDIGADEYVPPPLVIAASASPATETSVEISSNVTPNGRSTTYHVEYGPTVAYGLRTAEVAIGSGTSAITAATTISGLGPSTSYHARTVATSSRGVTLGDDASFMTATPPTPEKLDRPGPADQPRLSEPDATSPLLGGLAVRSRASIQILTFSTSEPVRVNIRVERLRFGRRLLGHCRLGGALRPDCVTTHHLGSFTVQNSTTAGTAVIPRRIGGVLLGAGQYRLTAVATDAAGNRSVPRRVGFELRA